MGLPARCAVLTGVLKVASQPTGLPSTTSPTAIRTLPRRRPFPPTVVIVAYTMSLTYRKNSSSISENIPTIIVLFVVCYGSLLSGEASGDGHADAGTGTDDDHPGHERLLRFVDGPEGAWPVDSRRRPSPHARSPAEPAKAG